MALILHYIVATQQKNERPAIHPPGRVLMGQTFFDLIIISGEYHENLS